MSTAGYKIIWGSATLGTVASVTIDRSISRDTNLRTSASTTDITIKGYQTASLIERYQGTDDEDQYSFLFYDGPSWGDTYSNDSYQSLTIKYVADDNTEKILIDKESAKLVSVTTSNNSDSRHLRVRDYTIKFTVFDENIIYLDDIKNVSSITHSYSSTTDQDSFAYARPTTLPATNTYYPKPTYTDSADSDQTESSEGPSYTITRTISAVGIKTKDNSAYNHAQTAVNQILQDDDVKTRLSLDDNDPFDLITKTTSDHGQGSYSLVETYILYTKSSGKKYRDNYSINIVSDNRSEDNLTTATINGTIQGLNTQTLSTRETDQFANNKSSNADIGWTEVAPLMYDRITNGMASVNPIATNKQLTYNTLQGTIDYSFTYNTRPLSLVSGALSEAITMSDSYQNRKKLHVPIIGGPTSLQDLGTYTVPSRTVTYTAQFPRGYGTQSVEFMIDNAIDQFDPKELNINPDSDRITLKSKIDSSTTSTDIVSNTITKTKKWIYYI